jgi:hypothetical protein
VNKDELEEMLRSDTFSPFVLTTKDGFALPVSDPRNTLVGIGMLVIKHQDRIHHIPFNAIAHITQPGEHLG